MWNILSNICVAQLAFVTFLLSSVQIKGASFMNISDGLLQLLEIADGIYGRKWIAG